MKVTFDKFGKKSTAAIRVNGNKVGYIERVYHTALPGSLEKGRFLYCYHAKVHGPQSGDWWGDTFYADDHDARAALAECRFEAKRKAKWLYRNHECH